MAADATFERDYRILSGTGRCAGSPRAARRARRRRRGDLDARRVLRHDADRAQRRHVRAALEAAPNAIFLVDEQGRIQLANARASLHVRLRERGAAEPAHGTLIPNGRTSRNAPARPGPLPLLERRGSSRELLARAPRSRAGAGGLALNPSKAAGAGSVSDITERLLSEHESAQQRNELAHLSRVAMIGEMSSSLAHELNQP
jgi:two-component system sensor kinase FixL